MTTPTESTPNPATPTNGKRRRILTIIASVFVVVGILWFALWYIVLSEREKTDDAYVNGDQVTVTSQIAGTVVGVFTSNTQLVNAGQVLVKLDPTDAETALSRAAGALAQSVRQVRQQQAMAGQYDAQAARSRLELSRAEEDLARRAPLLADQAIASEEVKHAEEAVAMAHATLSQALRQSDSAHALTDGVAVRDNPIVQTAQAAYRDAFVNASRNAIVAPVTGYVALRSVQLGQHIQGGEPLLSIVPLQGLWVDANFKEGQLRRVKLGMPAKVIADIYGSGVVFHGKVAGIGGGTGSSMALIPAQNATGNWIKVVQRLPVRIELDPADLAAHPLRLGLSTEVEIDLSGN